MNIPPHNPSDDRHGLSTVLRALSHDVRNSLRALREVPHWLEEDLKEAGVHTDATFRDHLTLMTTHAARLDQMMVDLSDYARIGTEGPVGQASIAQALSVAKLALPDDPHLEICTSLAAETALCRETDLVRLFKAALSNVITHHPGPNKRLTIGAIKTDTSTEITLKDNGPGIPEQHRQRMLEILTTLQPRDVVEGSGMGLAKIDKIMRVHDGTLSWLGDCAGVGLRLNFPNIAMNE